MQTSKNKSKGRPYTMRNKKLLSYQWVLKRNQTMTICGEKNYVYMCFDFIDDESSRRWYVLKNILITSTPKLIHCAS